MSDERLVKFSIFTRSNGLWNMIVPYRAAVVFKSEWIDGCDKTKLTIEGRVGDIDANRMESTFDREEITAIDIVEINQAM